jgi:hypothetical protein
MIRNNVKDNRCLEQKYVYKEELDAFLSRLGSLLACAIGLRCGR